MICYFTAIQRHIFLRQFDLMYIEKLIEDVETVSKNRKMTASKRRLHGSMMKKADQIFNVGRRTREVTMRLSVCVAVFGILFGAAKSDLIISSANAQSGIEKLESEVKTVLGKHCAKCHQVGKTTGKYKDRPAKNFGYILDLERLQKTKLIKPGLPNASTIYVKMQTGEMPKGTDDDCYTTLDDAERKAQKLNCGPTAEEIAAVKNWIEKLEEKPVIVARTFISDDEIINAMAQDISQVSEFIRPQIRYFTLTNLFNAGDSDKALGNYRQALYAP